MFFGKTLAGTRWAQEILCCQRLSQHHSFVAAAPLKLLPLFQRFTRWGDRLLEAILTGIKIARLLGTTRI
ncbi:hypothetical protein GC1_20285 [Leisingera sp. ANG1]|nr:hypothetical protein RA21_08185 [Leisingera sp. ANG-DT]KIC24196.1 hypothetical protein RA23_10950 [Leisingera sp. ANG-S3]KIC26995.1 hypothetical protein RA24_17655 [Leisingera sp. ANG-M6]KIC33046.1 hypothetical protein RA25_11180 [Leisingera sp. ANG-S5]KIC52912.1 hypothetical protein RA22_12555 [Leisingera sp. ANG-S]KID07312.1 hypothetical protein GC1_20285 [Leisingera sp. ANG1]